MDIEEKHKQLIDIARGYMTAITDSEHNIKHMEDVVCYTKMLLDEVDIDVNKEACIISAYFHDVGRIEKDRGHEELSAQMLKENMEKLNYDDAFIKLCYDAIINHRWDMEPLNNEGYILKDADKLAFLGSGRWNSCIENNQRLDDIICLLPKIRNEILHFEQSRKIYDIEIVKLIELLYNKLQSKI